MTIRELPPIWPSPIRRSHADVLRIAHRGGSNGPAPYGLANLRRIARLGAHLLEFDVRTTRDDALVVAHDSEIVLDTPGSAMRIEESSIGEIRAALGADHDDLDVAGVARRAREAGLGLYVDVKTVTAVAARSLVQVIDRERMTERTILASADPAAVALCAEVAPRLPRSVLFVSDRLDALELARSVEAHFVHPCWERFARPHERLANMPWLAPLREERVGIVTWHVEDRQVAEGLYALGVDGVCTDEPELLASVAASP